MLVATESFIPRFFIKLIQLQINRLLYERNMKYELRENKKCKKKKLKNQQY